jgi:hypothetical protein
MKYIVILFIALFSSNFKAQSNVLKISCLDIYYDYNVRFEQKISNKYSIQLGFTPSKYQGKGIDLSFRYYFKESLKGFYFASFNGYNSQSYINVPSIPVRVYTIKSGLAIGYQLIQKKHYFIDFGLSYYNSMDFKKDFVWDLGLYGLGIFQTISIGYDS